MGQWAEPGGGRLRGFLSAALCELRILVPSSFHFISVIFSLFHLISNISGVVSRNLVFPVCIFCSLRTWIYGTEQSHLCQSIFRWVGMRAQRLMQSSLCCRASQKPRLNLCLHTQPCCKVQPSVPTRTHKSGVLNLTQRVAPLGLRSWKNLHFQSTPLGILVWNSFLHLPALRFHRDYWDYAGGWYFTLPSPQPPQHQL